MHKLRFNDKNDSAIFDWFSILKETSMLKSVVWK